MIFPIFDGNEPSLSLRPSQQRHHVHMVLMHDAISHELMHDVGVEIVRGIIMCLVDNNFLLYLLLSQKLIVKRSNAKNMGKSSVIQKPKLPSNAIYGPFQCLFGSPTPPVPLIQLNFQQVPPSRTRWQQVPNSTSATMYRPFRLVDLGKSWA